MANAYINYHTYNDKERIIDKIDYNLSNNIRMEMDYKKGDIRLLHLKILDRIGIAELECDLSKEDVMEFITILKELYTQL